MQLPLSIFIASRHLQSKRDNRFISFVAFISTVGLVLGVATLITVLSVLNGFEQQMKDKILGVIPHIQIYTPAVITDWQPLLEDIKKSDSNITHVAPSLNTQVMISKQQITKEAPHVLTLNGIVPEYEKNLSFLGQAPKDGQGMLIGSLDTLNDPQKNNLIIGEKLANDLDLKVGDGVHVILPKASDAPSGITPIAQTFTISGIFKLSKQTEQYIAITSMHSIAQTLNVEVGAQGFRVQLNDVFLAPTTAEKLAQLDTRFSVYHWMQTHGSIHETLQMQRNLSGLLLFLIVIVAGFNLVSSLVMVVTEKKSDIAILKTMGAAPRFVWAVFFWQGLVITLIGTTLGAILGVLLSYYIGGLSGWVNTRFKLNLFDDYFVTQLPSVIHIADVLGVVLLSLLIAALAIIYPARQAAKIEPAQTLRYE